MCSGQLYDHTPCNTTAPPLHGSTYTCNSDTKTCNTYAIYRPQLSQQLSDIAGLFNVNESELQPAIHLQHREVVVPIICDCPDRSSRALINYTNNNLKSFLDIACGVYQGLVKPFVLEEQNGNLHETTLVKVPIKCACVNTSREVNSTMYLVSYPLMESDTIDIVARKFGVTPKSIHEANKLDPYQTIFGGTTLLVPTTRVPVLNLDHVVNGPSSHEYTIPVNGIVNRSMRNRFSTFLIGFATVCLCGVILLLVFLKWKCRHQKPQVVSITGLEFKRFSPDFLDGMSKLKQSLTSFSFDELKLATQNFSESLLIGKSVYNGQITGGFPVVIEDMKSIESANHVINILTTINHFNVIRLEGCCFHMNQCYLVFEFVKNGSLRDCLHDSKTRKQLTWAKRVKLAFDIAEGLHYIHYCTKPTYAHHNISSGNILITTDWRAKISGFNLAKPIVYNVVAEGDGGDSAKYLECGQDSTKADVYAYGVVLMELLSAKEAVVGRKWLDRDVEVVAGSSECLEKFNKFMDVDLEGEYTLADALRLALLAKCCIHDDPEIRPTMNDVLKALSRIS
ncbi:lysM domain receptor-like kinase 4 [Bidens hawaiensis]|uniref:lysM domain receptor-like kinase 4 n=1 Tax=Bidens hawaiensis TaxID=980011 RepID=UPI00404AC64A